MTDTRRIRVGTNPDVELEVLEAGAGGQPLLLVHGFGGAKEDFADHVDALAALHRVITFDHRGHGESDDPPDPAAYSLDRMAADVLGVADAIGIDHQESRAGAGRNPCARIRKALGPISYIATRRCLRLEWLPRH